MVIDHIGIVVKDINKGIAHWEKIFGYQQMTEIVLNTRQKVRVVFLHKPDSQMIKLIEPSDETSPIYAFSKKGGGLHHLCFKCDDLNAQLGELSEKGLRILAHPQPGEAFENNDIAFFYAQQGLNVELIDTDKKANRLLPLIPKTP
ncbi:MAG: VOC family protein [bacterium]|nr:VOC family protein [bacterium]